MQKILLCAALAGGLGFAAPADAAGVKVGTLSCHEAGGWGFVFGSSRSIRCVFTGGGGRVERYQGSISKFGVDIGYQQSGVIVWAVVAPNDHPSHGALAGHYGGATAGASVGVGLGANVLIGGFERSFALQPLSVEGATGVNIAGGIAEMTLRAGGA
jgi:hypothetical protein